MCAGVEYLCKALTSVVGAVGVKQFVYYTEFSGCSKVNNSIFQQFKDN